MRGTMASMRTFAALLSIVVVAACEGSGTSPGSTTGTSGGLGARCIDYTSCVSPFMCFVAAGDLEGQCESTPGDCKPADCACIGDALASRCSPAGRCSARVDRSVHSCPAPAGRKAGEPCSVARGCEGGLYCRVDTATRLGKCERLPASCGTQATCECLKPEACGGAEFRECSVLGDEASTVCE